MLACLFKKVMHLGAGTENLATDLEVKVLLKSFGHQVGDGLEVGVLLYITYL
jgi:hypothetical protein